MVCEVVGAGEEAGFGISAEGVEVRPEEALESESWIESGRASGGTVSPGGNMCSEGSEEIAVDS